MSALLPLCYVTVVVFVIDMICKKQELMLQREREGQREGERQKGRYGRSAIHSEIETGGMAIWSVLLFTSVMSKLFAYLTLKSLRKLCTSARVYT